MEWIKQRFSALIGRDAEALAATYLQEQGLVLLEKNYHGPFGEIDLILRQEQELVFAEVKYRKNSQYGQAAEFFTESKRNKIIKTINHYMVQNRLNPNLIAHRIDVIAIDAQRVQWFKAV